MTKEDIKYIEDYLEWVRQNMNPAEVDFEHFANGIMNCNKILSQALSLHNVVRCASCDNNNDFSETGKQEICIEGEYRYVTATTCNKCGKAVEIDFFDQHCAQRFG